MPADFDITGSRVISLGDTTVIRGAVGLPARVLSPSEMNGGVVAGSRPVSGLVYPRPT